MAFMSVTKDGGAWHFSYCIYVCKKVKSLFSIRFWDLPGDMGSQNIPDQSPPFLAK